MAYYYGKFLPEQGGKALTIAVYSQDGRDGRLFNIQFGNHGYFVVNYTDLRKGESQWRVGEINGGLASYTRLWRLAQEIGARPRQRIAVSTITQASLGSAAAHFEQRMAECFITGDFIQKPADNLWRRLAAP